MQAETVFYLLLAIVVFDFGFNLWLKLLNASWFDKAVPEVVADVYDNEAYLKSQAYKKTNFKFGLFQYIFQSILLIVFLSLDGFAWVNDWVYQFTESPLIAALLFFGVLYAAQLILGIPFGYYQNFIIEERFGFNKSSLKLWLGDLLKSLLLSAIIGGGLLAIIFVIYEELQTHFWWVAWLVFVGFSLFMNLFYSKLIVPMFNKQSPLEDGSLRDQINAYAQQVGFTLKNIFIIDGSKRSTKANAYFSGFGNQKRITLYDTLIEKLEEEEIVSVLAHEVGHYQKKHIIYNILISGITT
ncbi:MAG: M48 family metallopeptidase, partial [Flavobacteriaceae bacterium]|nr:M48 family metallopeptidase [Flavobacteriaceae bacterium]